MPIRFLHFSDIHFGQGKPDGWEPHDDVRNEVLSDLQRVQEEGVVAGKADLVLVTGDIAQKGLEEEFKQASDWLQRVREIACAESALIRTVPGNHDINLSRLDTIGQLAHNAIRAEPDLEHTYNYLASAGAQAQNSLATKLDDYQSFAYAHGSDFPSFSQPFTITHLDLPGGRGLRLIGLCTVLVSDLKDAKGGMILGRHQYGISRDPRYEDIVMMHHPTEWLKDRYEAERYLRSRARILMTGHEHLPQITSVERDNDFQQIELGAGALNPPASEAGYGYSFNWIEIDWIADASDAVLSVTVYPRKWNPDITAFAADSARLSGKDRRTIKLSCGPRPVEPTPPLPSDPTVTAEEPLSVADAEIILALKETDVVPDVANNEDFERLRYLFWHHLSKQARIETLIQLGLLTDHARNRLPPAFERMAFEAAGDQGKLHDLWEKAMPQIPEADRTANPFQRGE